MKPPFQITAFPTVPLWPGGGSGNWLQEFISLHDSGRAALYWALRSLALPSDSTVWMPSYHCGVEVDAAIAAGYRVRFYRIGLDLTIDENDLRRRLTHQPGPVLIIHYFGFAQPGIHQIAELCSRHGCTLIEDCAHALFSTDSSGRQLGTIAPFAVFSLRKTLPLIDGGALRAAPQSSILPQFDRFAANTYLVYLKTVVRNIVGDRLTALYRTLRWRDDVLTNPNVAEPDKRSYRGPMSRVSRKIALAAAPSHVVERRRDNFTKLNQMLQGLPEYQPLWDALPPGACPLFLPVRTRNRTPLMAQLASRGIETFRFGASSPYHLDPTEFPEAATLRDHIVCLPIHQDLERQHLERIAIAFRESVMSEPREAVIR
jgi:perosamine synthetase